MTYNQYGIISIHSQSFAEAAGKNLQKCQFLEAGLLSITNSAGQRCWETYHDFGGTFNKVFWCRGDRSITSSISSYFDGTERFFVQINHASTTVIGLGLFGEFSPQEAAGNQGLASGLNVNCNASSTMQLHFYGTPNSFDLIHSQTAQISTNDCLIAGQLEWKNLSKAHRGNAFSAGPIASGSNITIGIDRDMRDGYANRWGGFAVSGIVHIHPATPSGSALPLPASGNISKITAITPNSITVDTITWPITGAAIIGEMCRRLIRNNEHVNGGSSFNWQAGSASTTAITLIDDPADQHYSTSPDVGEFGYPLSTKIVWGMPEGKGSATGGQEGFFGYAHNLRLALSATAGFFNDGDLFFDTWKMKYYRIFGSSYGTVQTAHMMFPFTGSTTGLTIFAGKMRNYLEIENDTSRNTSGIVNVSGGGIVRDLWLNDFDFPSGSFLSSENCVQFYDNNLVFINDYTISQLSSSIRQVQLANGCFAAQGPFFLFARGTTQGLRGRTDPYSCVRENITISGTFFPLGRS